jgi:hypothetical protein
MSRTYRKIVAEYRRQYPYQIRLTNTGDWRFDHCSRAHYQVTGAVLAWFSVDPTPPTRQTDASHVSPFKSWLGHLSNPALRAAFGIGFLILFAFFGTFTYVNYVLVREPFGIGMMMLGVVYFVFLSSIVTTPLADRVVARLGARPTLCIIRRRLRRSGPAVERPPAAFARRLGAGRGRPLFCPGDRHRLCQPCRRERSRLGERPLPGLPLFGRPGRQRRARSGLRSPRLDGQCRGNRRVAGAGRGARHAAGGSGGRDAARAGRMSEGPRR